MPLLQLCCLSYLDERDQFRCAVWCRAVGVRPLPRPSSRPMQRARRWSAAQGHSTRCAACARGSPAEHFVHSPGSAAPLRRRPTPFGSRGLPSRHSLLLRSPRRDLRGSRQKCESIGGRARERPVRRPRDACATSFDAPTLVWSLPPSQTSQSACARRSGSTRWMPRRLTRSSRIPLGQCERRSLRTDNPTRRRSRISAGRVATRRLCCATGTALRSRSCSRCDPFAAAG